jgi:mannosyltransferase OCH1-like enzyme
MSSYPRGFEEDELLRSTFVRHLTIHQLERAPATPKRRGARVPNHLPRSLVRYWHDLDDVPWDVRECLDSWEVLRSDGFSITTFDDRSAAVYIAERYGRREVDAFAQCRHPAMRSDYFRLCYILAEGGLYVDADDVLVGSGWKDLIRDGTLKLQPLGYDITLQSMLPAAELRRADLATEHRIFYVNNDPIAAAAGHPVLRMALVRATDKLLGDDPAPEIQSTTGPGNLTASLVAYAHEVANAGLQPDFELLLNWDSVAEQRWDLEYRGDHRNWRNMDAS